MYEDQSSRATTLVVPFSGPSNGSHRELIRESHLARNRRAIAGRGYREREVRRVASALARFDDRTLIDFGIADRRLLEEVARFCLDC
jgi:hypothetical protein